MRDDSTDIRPSAPRGEGQRPVDGGPHGIAVTPDKQQYFVSLGHGRPFGTVWKYAAKDDQVLGKPLSEVDALAMWERLSGRMHQVLTGVAVGDRHHIEAALVSTRVHFRPLGRAEMAAYWRSGEPADKAGGYAIQGLGAVFVDAIEGSYSNVVGLPLSETAALLARFGIRVLG